MTVCLAGLAGLAVFDTPIGLVGRAEGATLYVNTTGSGGAYTSIQDAVNDSSDGDTVYIYNGSYYEHLTINTSINLTGENRNDTIIYGGFDGDGIIVESNWVNITGFTVTKVGHKSNNQAIELNNVNNCSISEMNISGNYEGLFLLFSENNNITNNIVQSNRYYGIYLSSSHNNVLSGSEFINNGHGLRLFHSDLNLIEDNNASFNNDHGIYLTDSSDNHIKNNLLITNAEHGIYFSYSRNNNLTNNKIFDDGIMIYGFTVDEWFTHSIDTSNNVNGKPVYYFKNKIGGTVPSGAGQIILANCDNVLIQYQNITNCTAGILLGFSTYINIYNNNISNSTYGIYLTHSNTNAIINNNISFTERGITLRGVGSRDNMVINNNVMNNDYGIYLSDSKKNEILGNSLFNNTSGIHLTSATDYNITNNILGDSGIYIEGYELKYWNSHMIDTLNTVNGKPVYYWKNQTGGIVPTGAGQVILANCTNVTISDQDLSFLKAGIGLGYSSNCTIADSNVSDNEFGIFLQLSTNNTINNITAYNNENGIKLSRYSINNRFISNNIIDNDIGIVTDTYSGWNKYTKNNIEYNSIGMMIDSDGNNITYNFASHNGMGFRLHGVTGNNIIGNTAFLNDIYAESGFYLIDSYDNNIINNTASNNYHGIYLRRSDGNNISGNKLISNTFGLHFLSSDWNNVSRNTIFENIYLGFYLADSSNNMIFNNNIINNSFQANDDQSDNYWDKGYPLGGNFWSDYDGWDLNSTPDQNTPPPDGIGDIPYVIDLDSQDNYPLMEPSFDNLAPQIRLVSPLNNSEISSGNMLYFDIYEPNLDYCYYSLDGGSQVILPPPFKISTNGWSEGIHEILVWANDTLNYSSTRVFLITIDDTKPEIILNSHENNTYIREGEVLNFSVYDTNLQEVRYSVNGGPNYLFNGPYNITTHYWPDGDHFIVITARDTAGNLNISEYFFQMDMTPPTIWFTPSLNHSNVLVGTIIQFNINDPHLDNVTYSINGVEYIFLEDAYFLNTSTWDIGIYNITVRANDTQGNEREVWFEFTLYDIPPEVTFAHSDYSQNTSDNIHYISINLTFSKSMDKTNTGNYISLSLPVEYDFNWDETGMVLSISFITNVSSEAILYGITIDSGITDLNGTPMDSDYENEWWIWPDWDNDGIPDVDDPDDDNDGVLDIDDMFPTDPTEWMDSDSDGIGDNADLDNDNDGVPDTEDYYPLDPERWEYSPPDNDSDGIPDADDTDDDNDGHPDIDDTFPLDPLEWQDFDGDGVGDNADTDDDDDGVPDENDDFPLDPKRWEEETQEDFTFYILLIIIIVIVSLILVMIFLRRNKGQAEQIVEEQVMEESEDPPHPPPPKNVNEKLPPPPPPPP
jgi:parallel beta-helix repeat protein